MLKKIRNLYKRFPSNCTFPLTYDPKKKIKPTHIITLENYCFLIKTDLGDRRGSIKKITQYLY